MVLPGDFRQIDFNRHDACERPLDLHVTTGENRHPALVIAVLIGIPWVPAAAQIIAAGFGLGLGLRRRQASQQEPRKGDRYELNRTVQVGEHPRWSRTWKADALAGRSDIV